MSDAVQAPIKLTPKEIAVLDRMQLARRSFSRGELKRETPPGVKTEEVEPILKKLTDYRLIDRNKANYRYDVNQDNYNKWVTNRPPEPPPIIA